MYVGKLNDLISFSPSNVTLSLLKKVPTLTESGNPLKGEPLFVNWRDKAFSDIDIRLPFARRVFVDCVKLELPAKLKLSAISLYAGEKAQLLQRYIPETGSVISKREIMLDANYETDLLLLTFEGDISGVGLDNLEVFGSYGEGGLYPTPVDAEITDTRVPVSEFRGCWSDCQDGLRAAQILMEKLSAKGAKLPVAENGGIRFLQDGSVAENGFRLEIREDGAEIYASDLRGFVYGAETVVKLFEKGTLPICRISDKPAMAFRGVHLWLPARENIPFFKRLVEHILSPMGYNCIFLQISAGMEFESHPKINEAYIHAIEQAKAGIWPEVPHGGLAGGKVLTKKEVADLVACAKKFGIDVIPEVQSLGHVQYLTMAYPEIAEIEEDVQEEIEIDTRNEDERPKKFYKHCYCPSNPKSYEILFDVLDEIIEVVKPQKYVHMGHDEIYEIGVCPVCKKSAPEKLLADDITRIHDYLAQKGLTMMMWADMLQPVTKYKAWGAIDLIPKDIIMLDFIWYFHMSKDIEDNLLDKGFKVMFGNMYSSHFPRYESRIKKDGMVGAQTSAWVGVDPEVLGREGKLYEFLFSAQMMWSDSYSSNYKFTYDRMLKAQIPEIRAKLLDCDYPSMHENAFCKTLAQGAEGVFEANCRCDSLVFCHTADQKLHRIPWKPLEEIGQYVVEYEDGVEVTVPVTYGGNICFYGRRQNEPFSQGYYRHNGYTATFAVDSEERRESDGSYYCVYRYEWLNPRPEHVVRQVVLRQKTECPANIVVQKICAMER